jgi:hypothetical protein
LTFIPYVWSTKYFETFFFLPFSYYRQDGQCNSASNPILGARYTPQIRLVHSSFVDEIDTLPSFRTRHSSRSDSVIGNNQKGPFISERIPLINNDYSLAAWQLFTHETMKTFKAQVSFFVNL